MIQRSKEEFDPNKHDALNSYTVFIKRLGKEFPVKRLSILKCDNCDGSSPHIWGFAEVPNAPGEFDVTWGDILKQHPEGVKQ